MERTKEPVVAMMYVELASGKLTVIDLMAVEKPMTRSSSLTEAPATIDHSLPVEEIWNRCVKVGSINNKIIAVPV